MVGNSSIKPKDELGTALQDAVLDGHLDVAKQLLGQGLMLTPKVVDMEMLSKPQHLIDIWDRETLNLLLEAGAYIHIAKVDAFHQTPLHIAASHNPEVLQALESSLNSAANNEKGDAWRRMYAAINQEDIDGCTPLHRAVENSAGEAAEWLIKHGADVNIEDFNKLTPFQRASQLMDFGMMCRIFPRITKSSIKAADWRACVPSITKRNIILALGPNISPVQVKSGQQLTQYFYAMSYSLAFSTPSVPAQGDKCVANDIPHRAVVLLENDSLLGQSFVEGVCWRWWRKVMKRKPQPTMEKDKVDQWH
ncbi:hypothetical protein N7481_012751 [Penicillium waksmanii]|uniref:uncharacterized protein n=1 Tax=Penicillium waksmanii TaxID=69791 RepID=UPI00254856D8|nr:uncharacterized protein N7481_012751 [Penicillium waksmanii]KAJ5966037.1 hypothetical protein N7481_012751 [Penicillium waksmanii]